MTEAGFRDVCVERTAVQWLITDKAQFEDVLVNTPLQSNQLDKKQLAIDLPQILETVIPNYKNVTSFQLRCTANIGYGFK